jgi:hypothetical protein
MNPRLATGFCSNYFFAVPKKHLDDRRADPCIPVPTTKLQRLKQIWDELLPHRVLEILEASVKVRPSSGSAPTSYDGADMSDGERAIFYFLGQCLAAPDDGALIIDEPEAHIHRSILGPLWDAIEKTRPDCGFVLITHDLAFAVERTSASKYFLRNYEYQPQAWDIESLPENTDLPENVVAELVGSRKPILFVEGDTQGSLDLTVYRHQCSSFTIVPMGSCDAVIRSVKSFKANPALHRIEAKGVVDADHRSVESIADLKKSDVYVLPVAEIENVLLLPAVFAALATAFYHVDPTQAVASLTQSVLGEAQKNIDAVSARCTMRQIDGSLKRVEVDAKDLASLQSTYTQNIATIDPASIFNGFKSELDQSIQSRNLAAVLRLYDNKGLLAHAATILGIKDKKELMNKVRLLLAHDNGKTVREELTKVLPAIAT